MNSPESKTDQYVDFKGWRFTAPFRCLCCGKMIGIRQFCFGRSCPACDVGRCRHPKNWCSSYSGPRELIDPNAQYFIPEENWLNPPTGLDHHADDETFPEREAILERIRTGAPPPIVTKAERLKSIRAAIRELERVAKELE